MASAYVPKTQFNDSIIQANHFNETQSSVDIALQLIKRSNKDRLAVRLTPNC